MKKILITMITALAVQGIYAQDEVIFGDVMVERNIQLTDYYNEKILNDPMPKLSTTDVSLRLNLRLYDGFGIWAKASILFDKSEDAPKSNILGEFPAQKYYILNERNYTADSYVDFGISGGLFYQKYLNEKLRIVPYLGLLLRTFDTPSQYFDAKEIGSNNKYDVSHYWGNEYCYSDMPFVTLEVQVSYRIHRFWDVTLGLSYRQSFQRLNFLSEIRDSYNYSNLIRRSEFTGNYMNTLGVSLGVSFR